MSRRGLLVGAGASAVVGVGGFLFGRRAVPAARGARPEFTQLTYRTGRVFTARFSRDGASLYFGAAWDGEPLQLYQLDRAAGGPRALDLPPADVLAVGPRGELAICLDRRYTDHQSATGQLAVIRPEGGAPRMLADAVEDADFAPDGALAAIRRVGGASHLELPLGTSRVESPGWLTHARVSPDGRHVAYLEHPSSNDDAGAVMVLDLATGATRALGGEWASLAGLAWDPGGRSIWFTAAATGALNEVHTVGLDGELRTVAQTTGRLRLHDLAPDGRAAVTVDAWRMRTLVGGPGLEDHDRSLSEFSLVSDLSADRTTLALAELGDVEREVAAYLVPVDGGKPLRLGTGFPLAIAPSGQQVAVNLALPDGSFRLVAASIASAEQRPIATPGRVSAARWIDEDTLVATAAGRAWRLSRSGPPVALTPAGQAGELAIDPARRRCAFVGQDARLHVIELVTGEVTTLPGDHAEHAACGWLATPDAILIRSTTTPIVLDRVDPATGAATRYLEIAPPAVGLKAVDALVISADGSRYAYSYGQELSRLHELTLAT